MKQSIWSASSLNVEHFRKFKSHYVLDDVANELNQYHSFKEMDKEVVLKRVFNSIKQSFRVRGINWLFKMRRSFIAYEASLGAAIQHSEKEVLRNKQLLRDNWPDLEDPNTSIASVIKYYQFREKYLKSKIRLESLIHHKKNVRMRITTKARDLLKEQ